MTYASVGLQMAATVTVFVYAGYRLDLYYSRSPLFLATGAFVGMFLGFYNLYREITRLDEQNSDHHDDPPEDDVPRRWM